MALKGGNPVSPYLIDRVKSTFTALGSGVVQTIRGVQDAWMSPNQPLAPVSQASQGRQFDYQVGYNTLVQPKSANNSGVTFDNLIALADNCDIVRILIEDRKDQMEALRWEIKPKNDSGASIDDPRIKVIQEFFRKPDRRLDWKQWLRGIIEEMLVTDAVSIYRQKTKGGAPYAFELIDGSTIAVKIDEDGRTPLPPDVAYQQVLKGTPAVDYSSDELIYYPRNLRPRKVYGYSPVEQIIVTINIAIRRMTHQLQYYTDGNLPDALIGTPEDWTPAQVADFQKYWDGMYSGNLANRRRGTFVPGKADNIHEIVQPPLKDQYDEWIARIACFAFKVSCQPFVSQVNRATAEVAQSAAQDGGMIPTMEFVKSIMDRILAEDFGSPDLEFSWHDAKEEDSKKESEVLTTYTGKAVMKINEARAKLGLDPDPSPNADRLGVITASGWVPLEETPEEKQSKMDMLTARASAAGPTGQDDGGEKGAEKLQKKKPTPSAWRGKL